MIPMDLILGDWSVEGVEISFPGYHRGYKIQGVSSLLAIGVAVVCLFSEECAFINLKV